MNISRFRSFPLLLVILLLGASLVAISPAQAGQHANVRAAVVKTTSAHILVTPKGRTLYVFAADSQNKSACYGQCAKFWPPRRAPAHTPSKIAGVPGTFGVITRTDGTHQLTYDGAPLYTFAADKKRGDMNGQGLLAAGGYWWVVVAAGK